MKLVAANEVGNEREQWVRRYREVRARTEALAAPLSAEDQTIQSMADVSPTKWHRAHMSWFFETFLLGPHLPNYRVFDAAYGFLFNSYYEAVGPRYPRPQRGLMSRPGVTQIARYRARVDGAMRRLMLTVDAKRWLEVMPLLELGLNHEEQHQELLLMDIKHVLSSNPTDPAYHARMPEVGAVAGNLEWVEFEGGLREIGNGGATFAFDNEGPRHRVWLEPFRLASRLVTCGDYLAFIADDGYRRPELWLSDGWAAVGAQGWQAPLYWRNEGAGWTIFTLAGRRPIELAEPVCHVSHYEADAFARWRGKRLSTEAEWEIAAIEHQGGVEGHLVDRDVFHPLAAGSGQGLRQMAGDVWEWTASPYAPYPGYRPAAGAVGEYNGKFMSNQMVLRGGACVTPRGHVRPTYRNFFPPAARWCFGGIRLAEDAS